MVRTFVRDAVGLVSVPGEEEVDLGLDPAALELLDEGTLVPSPRVAGMLVYDPRRMGYGRVVRLAVGDLAARTLASTVGFVSFARALTLHVTRVDAVAPAELNT